MDGFQLQAAAGGQPDPAQQALLNAINNNVADVHYAAAAANIYSISGEERDPKDDTLGAMAKAGFVEFARMDYIYFQVLNQAQPNDRIYQYYRSKDGEVMVDSWLERNRDLLPQAQQLPLSEIHWQVRSQEMLPTNLRLVMQWEVNNIATCRTAKLAFDMLFGQNKSPRVFSVNSTAANGSIEAQCFDALLRTQNVRPTNWMLADHHTSFGNKQIRKITVQPLDRPDPSAPEGNPWYRGNIYLDLA